MIEMTHVKNNSGNNEWYTPAAIIDAARAVLGSIDVDPASNEIAQKYIQAKMFYTQQNSGLAKDWIGNVWLNPPYAIRELTPFINKFLIELEKGNVKSGIVLTNNGTETKWGQALLKNANAVCFPKGRIRFLDSSGQPKQTPLQGQMITFFGQNEYQFVQTFAQFGFVLP
jgi:hypothetical protein